mgnify:CR=1 FL=1
MKVSTLIPVNQMPWIWTNHKMTGIKKNTFGIYNSSSDLFHVGSYELAQSVTAESFLKIFNVNYEQNLPDFNAGYFDTSRTVLSNGVFSENR